MVQVCMGAPQPESRSAARQESASEQCHRLRMGGSLCFVRWGWRYFFVDGEGWWSEDASYGVLQLAVMRLGCRAQKENG